MSVPEHETRNPRRRKSWEVVRRRYHRRGWQSPFLKYEDLLAASIRPGAAVLEVGCGRDFQMADFLMRCGACVHGIDPVANDAMATADVTIRRGTAESIPYGNGTFDLVTSRAVLEHLREPVAAFREFHRVLKDGGWMIFLAANKWDYVSLLSMAVPNRLHGRIVRLLTGRSEDDTFLTYYRANTLRRIRQIAQVTGFDVERVEHLSHFPYMLTFSSTLCRVAIAYDEFIGRFPGGLGLRGWLLGRLVKSPAARVQTAWGESTGAEA
jgi:ubiquinone/menaquinone biosynthesis C-methylase UbiE